MSNPCFRKSDRGAHSEISPKVLLHFGQKQVMHPRKAFQQHIVRLACGIEETNFHRRFAAAMLCLLWIGSASLQKTR